jgi:SAM-dependent methyltransferase
MITPVEMVKRFWDGRAEAPGVGDSAVTHADVWQRELEIATILKFLGRGDRVLDVGCGSGYTTKRLAAHVAEVIGIDYSDAMIQRAVGSGPGSAIFAVKDVLDLGPADFGVFDVVVSERCLINLSGWPEQRRAIDNVARVLRPGGRFIFLEGGRQGRQNLNQLRTTAGLDVMPTVWHNVDFDEAETLAYVERDFVVEHRPRFGVYDFVARVVHPLLVAPEPPVYDSRINEIAASLAVHVDAFPELNRVFCLVLRRREGVA